MVGVLKKPDNATNITRQREFAAFTQSQFRSTTSSADDGPTSSQSEIVDFAILSLFRRYQGSFYRPPHLLCHGFQWATDSCFPNEEHGPMSNIPGIVPQYPNKNVFLLKNFPWTNVLGLLGKNCEEIMLHLLLDCGLFIQLEGAKSGTYYQLSGIPLVDLQTSPIPKRTPKDVYPPKPIHTPGDIVFVRRRMFYARAALNAKGQVRFGLRHIHVLNRYPDSSNLDHTVHIMRYIFPRQFGLHNVFTSTVDRKETVQPFKDYTLREKEIAQVLSMKNLATGKTHNQNPNKIPRRLRGQLVSLIQKLQKRHRACAYVELLRYYCPVNQDIPTGKCSMVEFATPVSSVSAFCRAVMKKLIPNELFGCGDDKDHNRDNILRYVDVFIRLGRYESLSLHEVSQGLKITSIPWLQPPKKSEGSPDTPGKVSLSDIRKRTEIFLEFVYYLFDSLLIPLIRCNFYVTESGVHRNRLFYFRHDVWRKLAEPSIMELKTSLFEEVKRDRAKDILSRRSLAFGHLRLLPKAVGARPIVNLRRRPEKKVAWGRRTELGPSINILMTPVANVLNYEKGLQPEALGSAIWKVGDIYARLKGLKEKMVQRGIIGTKPFYFVKLDVQSCFDTIPQKRLMQLIEQLVGEDEYRITKHVEVKPGARVPHHPGEKDDVGLKITRDKPIRKFVSKAVASSDFMTPYDIITHESATTKKPSTVFVDLGVQRRFNTNDLLNLLAQHIGNNLVKIGKKFYRQKNGIPQGSVVSTLLCNFFYGEHETRELGFLREPRDDEGVLLMRLVDDYLLITTDREVAQRFLQVMLDGNPNYGISVSAGKTLVNFDATVNGLTIPRLPASAHGQFPYCGTLIDTRTLAIIKDRPHKVESSRSSSHGGYPGSGEEMRVSDTLTVESSKRPGQTFHRKTLTTFRLHLHAMFVDATHNAARVVMANLHAAFIEAAMKIYRYHHALRSRPGRRRLQQRKRSGNGKPASSSSSSSSSSSTKLLIRIISGLIRQAQHIVQQTQRPEGSPTQVELEPAVRPWQVSWLAGMAFRQVLGRKQTGLGEVLSWLDQVVRKARPRTHREAVRLWRVVRGAESAVGRLRF
ncbi:hypothetical protein VTO42DRAFT_7616 [Malbranchea cinnamomea]